MTDAKPAHLTQALQDAHAMEVNAFESLENLITTTHDDEFLHVLQLHKRRTHAHARRLQELLERHGHEVSSAKDAGGTLRATVKGFTDQLRGAKPLKNARDAYALAHMQIAAYALLEHLAAKADDMETAAVAHEHRLDEEALAEWISERWSRFVDVLLSGRPDAA